MNKFVFNSFLAKVSTIAPFLGKALVDIELKKINKTPATVTPAEIIQIVNHAINPKLFKELKTTNSVLLAGAAQIITDSNDQIVYINSAAKKIISMLKELYETKENQDGYLMLEKHGLIKSVKNVKSVEVWEHIDKKLNRFYNVSISPLLNNAGSITGICTVIQDFTLKNEIEKDLFAYSDELKSEIDIRKKAQEVVIASSKMAALGEMAGGIAHEINTPLAVIQLYATQIKDLLSDVIQDVPKIHKVAEKIEKQVDRISTIVNGLKKFSRSDENSPMEMNDVNQIIHDTLDFCLEKFKKNGVRFSMQLPEPSPKAVCNAVEISQVLLNLLNNSYDAIQSLPDKWINLEVNESDDFIDIMSTDSGNGIPVKIRGSIFQPFFTTKGVGVGTGLGLSISKGIMQSHGGDLLLEENSPHTKFVMRLKK